MDISLTLSQFESFFFFVGSASLLLFFIEVFLSVFGRKFDNKN